MLNVLSTDLGFSSYYKLDNLVAIVDVNRLGQSQETMLGHDVETYRKRFEAFGFNAIVVDGNDVADLMRGFVLARFVLAIIGG